MTTIIPIHKPKHLRHTILGMAGAGLFLIGLGVGGAGSAPVSATPSPTPAKTSTTTVTQEVPTTPAACRDALDKADRLLDLAVEGFNYTRDAIAAAAELDAKGIDKSTADLHALTPKVQQARSDYDTAAAACRAS